VLAMQGTAELVTSGLVHAGRDMADMSKLRPAPLGASTLEEPATASLAPTIKFLQRRSRSITVNR
jgi:hypothetical protein